MNILIAVCLVFLIAIFAQSIGLKSFHLEWWVFVVSANIVANAVLQAIGVFS